MDHTHVFIFFLIAILAFLISIVALCVVNNLAARIGLLEAKPKPKPEKKPPIPILVWIKGQSTPVRVGGTSLSYPSDGKLIVNSGEFLVAIFNQGVWIHAEAEADSEESKSADKNLQADAAGQGSGADHS